jgi:hypothetical protein
MDQGAAISSPSDDKSLAIFSDLKADNSSAQITLDSPASGQLFDFTYSNASTVPVIRDTDFPPLLSNPNWKDHVHSLAQSKSHGFYF